MGFFTSGFCSQGKHGKRLKNALAIYFFELHSPSGVLDGWEFEVDPLNILVFGVILRSFSLTRLGQGECQENLLINYDY